MKTILVGLISLALISCATHVTDKEFVSQQPADERTLVEAGINAYKNFKTCVDQYKSNEVALKNNCARFVEDTSFIGEFVYLNTALGGYQIMIHPKRAGFFECFTRDPQTADLAGSLKKNDTLAFKGKYGGITWTRPGTIIEQSTVKTIILKDCSITKNN